MLTQYPVVTASAIADDPIEHLQCDRSELESKVLLVSVVPDRISIQNSRHCWRSHLPHASALIQRDFGCVLEEQETKQLPYVAKVDLHPLSTVSPDSNSTIVELQAKARLVSEDNFIPFCRPHPSFIAPLAVEASVVLRQG
ncbi:hypothetical protein TNCV_3405041 [Trichonephila clavipes]|nr:hypothetical protein TNCV_3405041 [Trichonephila clavipes]